MCARRILNVYQHGPPLGIDPAELRVIINGKKAPPPQVLQGLAKELDVDLRYLEKLAEELRDGRPSDHKEKCDRVDSFEEFQKANPDADCVCRHSASMHTPGSWCTQPNCGCTRFMTQGETEEFLLYCFGPPGQQAVRPLSRGRSLSRRRPH